MEETLTAILKQRKKEIERLENTLPTYSETNKAAEELLKQYNPSLQPKYCQYPKRCILGKAPTLHDIKALYGAKTVESWLIIQLNDFNESVNFKEDKKIQIPNMVQIARMTIAKFYYLKLSEVMLFFFNLKLGEYGKLYGRIDTITFFTALKQFFTDRGELIDQAIKEKQRAERDEAEKHAISYEEYCKRYKNQNKGV
nr:MAG TPA: bacterial xenogeneic silencer [Caudoviricetes sp.]